MSKEGIKAVRVENLPIEKQIEKAFNDPVMLAIARTESGLRTHAKGYNCKYSSPTGGVYSAACKTEDRVNAWSVDCGIFQINVIAKDCPAHLYDVQENIKAAKGKLQRQGYRAWTVYKTGAYRVNLN